MAFNKFEIDVRITCVVCKKEQTIQNVPIKGLVARLSGELIQNCFPEMNQGDRELFVSGTCNDCYMTMINEIETYDKN